MFPFLLTDMSHAYLRKTLPLEYKLALCCFPWEVCMMCVLPNSSNVSSGLVEVIPWTISKHLNVSHSWQPARSPGDIQYYGQIPALTDCLYRYMYQSKYVSLQDIDELILPQSVDR